jgi:hypothetical protein
VIIYLDDINLSVSIVESELVYRAVRTESSNISYCNLICERLSKPNLNHSKSHVNYLELATEASVISGVPF